MDKKEAEKEIQKLKGSFFEIKSIISDFYVEEDCAFDKILVNSDLRNILERIEESLTYGNPSVVFLKGAEKKLHELSMFFYFSSKDLLDGYSTKIFTYISNLEMDIYNFYKRIENEKKEKEEEKEK